MSQPPHHEPSLFESLLAQRPPLLAGFRTFYASFWEDGLVPRRTLELCRLRIARIHDCAAQWQTRDERVPLSQDELTALWNEDFARFTDAERAALELAERMPYQHHQIEDAAVKAVAQHLGEAGCVALTTAIAVFDARCRLETVLAP